VISDAHEGLKAAAAKVLKSTWQRCRGACLDFCVLRHSMSTEKDMYATQEHEEIYSPSIGAAA
jgi:hypothetical protein